MNEPLLWCCCFVCLCLRMRCVLCFLCFDHDDDDDDDDVLVSLVSCVRALHHAQRTGARGKQLMFQCSNALLLLVYVLLCVRMSCVSSEPASRVRQRIRFVCVHTSVRQSNLSNDAHSAHIEPNRPILKQQQHNSHPVLRALARAVAVLVGVFWY